MSTSQRTLPLAALSIGAMLLSATLAIAAPGGLDPTFGSGGRATIATGGTTMGLAVVQQSDGKIVVAGEPGLARFTDAGVADATFGVGGFLATGHRHFSVLETGDGKLLSSSLGFGVQHVTRYLSNGAVDTTFGSAGSFTRNGANAAGMMLIAQQADGKIVYVTTDEFGTGTRAVYAGRLTANGAVDATFNGGALRELRSFGPNRPGAIRLLSDGQVLVAGTSGSSFFVASMNPDGTMTSGFGTGGVALTDQSVLESPAGLEVSPAGIYVSGTSFAGGSNVDFTVVRLAWATGAVQQVARAGFGNNDLASALLLQPSGQLVVAGTADDAGNPRFGLVRFNADFTLDATYGTGGKAMDTGATGQGRALLRQYDGKHILAGDDGAGNFLVARFDARSPSTTALSATVPPTNPRTEAHFVAHVPSGDGGTVDFRDGGTLIAGCVAKPVVYSNAVCSTAALPSGARTITAQYSGSGDLLPSSSAPITHSVIYVFSVVIEGSQEVPAAATAATGSGTFYLDAVANQVFYTLNYAGLSGPETSARIHGFAGRGTSAGILHTMPAGSPKSGVFAFSEAQEASLIAGLAYVNIVTSAFPNGEIRGQIDNQGGTPKNLTVAVAGAGAAFGRVSGAGILCPSDCFEQYAHGTSVTLTATSTHGAPFTGWSGGGCTGTGPCVTTMNLTHTITATFGAAPPLFARMQYRLGEDDAGAVEGAAGANPTTAVAATAGWNLIRTGVPLYARGASGTGSLAMQFAPGTGYHRNDSAFFGVADNFGLEAWVRAEGALEGNATVAFVGWPGATGFGIVRSGPNYIGQLANLGSAGIGTVAGRWTHVAVARVNGTFRFYVNGIETGLATTATPPPIGASAKTMVGFHAEFNGQAFEGAIDDVRIFTLQPGTFQASMFNVRRYEALLLGNGSGHVATTGVGSLVCAPGVCNGAAPVGATATLFAVPAAGSRFGGWDGCYTVTPAGACVVPVDMLQQVSATFHLSATVRSPRDANGDGKSDIFWRDPSNQAALWFIDGLTVPDNVLLLGPGDWRIQAIADFNGDDRADIVWRETVSGMASMWLLDGRDIVNSTLILGPGTGWSVAHTGDFNGDGKADLLWKHTDGSYSIWLMDGLSVIGSAMVFGPGSPWTVTLIADLNGDGRSDLVWRSEADRAVSAWLMNGVQADATGFVFGGGTSWEVVHAGDFDGSGTADLLFRDPRDGRLSIFLMNGLAVTDSGIVYGGGAFDVTHVADFDGNGTADILFKDAGGQVAVWLIDALTVSSSGILFGGGGGWAVTHTGDYNGDGKSDLLWNDAGGQVAIWLLDGALVLGSAVIFGGNGGWVATP